MLETIYIARHGYRLNWVTQNWKSETGLPRDPPLAAFGHTQAQELADHFLSLPEVQRPTAIFSSPYWLSEWYSPVKPGSGLHPRPASAENLRSYFSGIDSSWSSIWYPSRRGEDVPEVHSRAEGFLAALIPELERRFEDKHKHILIVSHAATIIALTRALVRDRARPMRIACCSLTTFRRTIPGDEPLDGWKLVSLGDGSHLNDGATRDWGFEDIVIADGKVVDDLGQPGTESEDGGPVGLQLPAADIHARM
ncbi:uncharacterized protein PHACADRAFT_190138 [Phanerochaete carnosa HHB-10118-sp]|uniref:Phosphoglycerate mutase-like protein n=1 Tax=Phanerochaete carnosa (strain HHB-10118-sp) TaxID=650164 RepID=K5WNI5_PHACS|nr:uncharacterized protein PHACADRAFT_190138 [Phanerochaete carnosa HHB-10118-sp]EKM61005.1 hypothetical protein PHACADRAFT_190138 [Phanerochaete carnosa HHB-10118-sp]